MYTLSGTNYYEQVSQATGKLSSKLKELIATHSDDDRVYELSGEFVAWWHSPFTPSKDAVGRNIWTRADELTKLLAKDASKADKVGKVGKVIGKYVGMAAGVTVNATVKSGKWIRANGKPVTNNVWSATKDAYKKSRATAEAVAPAEASVTANVVTPKEARGNQTNDDAKRISDDSNSKQQSATKQSTDESPY